tara:strand:+ start:97 stop:504 length:408 start_codon:yes stop_codon:yes gene_type:complete
MEELLNYEVGIIENPYKNTKKDFEFKPSMLDYGFDKSSLRFQYIKDIVDIDERINEMSIYLREEIIPFDFPDEFYNWYARDVLDIKYTKYEITNMKRDYRIKKKRELKLIQDNKKKQKKDKKKIKVENKHIRLTF